MLGDYECLALICRYTLEEDSMYSRPIKRSNAAPSENTARLLQKGNFTVGVEDEIEEALASLHVAYPEDKVKDWNLTVKQMALRYTGEKYHNLW